MRGGHVFDRVGGDGSQPGLRHRGAQRVVSQHGVDLFRQRGHVLDRDNIAIDAVLHQFQPGHAAVGRDDRQRVRHGLVDDQPPDVLPRGQHKQVRRAVVVLQGILLAEAHKLHVVKVQLSLQVQILLRRLLPHDAERFLRRAGRPRAQQQIKPLARDELPHAEGDMRTAQPQLFPRGGLFRRRGRDGQNVTPMQRAERVGVDARPLRTVVNEVVRRLSAGAQPRRRGRNKMPLDVVFYKIVCLDDAAVGLHPEGAAVQPQPLDRQHGGLLGVAAHDDRIEAAVFQQRHNVARRLQKNSVETLVMIVKPFAPRRRTIGRTRLVGVKGGGHVHRPPQLVEKIHAVGRGEI